MTIIQDEWIEHDDLVEAFEYLDELRESGETNMFGARPYLVRDQHLDGKTAAAVLSAWMATFDGEMSAEDRALKVVKEGEGG